MVATEYNEQRGQRFWVLGTRRIEYFPTISNWNEYWKSFVTISLSWASLQGIFSFLSLTIRCILLYILFRSIQFLFKFPSACELECLLIEPTFHRHVPVHWFESFSLNMHYKFRHAFLRGVTDNSFRSYAAKFIQWRSQGKEHSHLRLQSCPINDYLNNFHDTPQSIQATVYNALSPHMRRTTGDLTTLDCR